MSIRQMPIPTDAQDKLIQSAIKLSEIQGKQETSAYDIAQNLQDQGDEVEKILAPYQQFLNFLDQANKKQQNATKELKRQAEEAQKIFNIEADRQEQEKQDKAMARRTESQARSDADSELSIMRLRADGENKAADDAEKELKIRQRARRIAEEQNISYSEAIKQARDLANLEEKVNKNKDGKDEGRRRIMGYSAERQGGSAAARSRAGMRAAESEQRRSDAYSRSFGGLKEFSANQTNPNFARPQTPMLDAAFGPVVNAVQQQTEVIRSLLTVD
jgi:hypothetical protein